MINYLWPLLMIVFSILAKQLDYRWTVGLGFLFDMTGLILVVNPDVMNMQKMISTLLQNLIIYLIAFVDALLWPIYSVLTKKYAQG